MTPTNTARTAHATCAEVPLSALAPLPTPSAAPPVGRVPRVLVCKTVVSGWVVGEGGTVIVVVTPGLEVVPGVVEGVGEDVTGDVEEKEETPDDEAGVFEDDDDGKGLIVAVTVTVTVASVELPGELDPGEEMGGTPIR